MDTKLYIQDSNQPGQVFYDSIISYCKKAIKGAGAFAFVTSAGLELLFKSPEFQDLITRGRFTLVVGMDAITNTASLNALRRHRSVYINFRVLAFISEKNNSIFHSKLIWFSSRSESKLIVGSGNLTLAGLRFNNEAYSESLCTSTEFLLINNVWDAWIKNNQQFLHEIDEEVVIQKAKANDSFQRMFGRAGIKVAGQNDRKLRPKKEDKPTEKEQEPVSVDTDVVTDGIQLEIESDIESEWVFDKDANILFAEIPKSGNRWKQVNFDKATFEGFFDATTATSSKYIILRSISTNGILGDIERRPNVSVASQNYRFELGAATGTYPLNGRPIAVIVKLGNATFLYELIMPDDKDYSSVLSFMNSRSKPDKVRMRRLVFAANDVKSELPALTIIAQMD